MECDFLEASPRPRIQWFMNNGTFPIAEETDQDEILFVENGRFLFIRVLTAQQRNSSFHCEVVNAFLGTRPQRSPTTYTLDGNIPPNRLEIYIGDRSVTAIIGEPVRVVYAAARSSNDADLVACPENTGVAIGVTSGVVVTFTVFDELRQPLNVNCSVLVDGTFTTVMYTLNIARKCVGCMMGVYDRFLGCVKIVHLQDWHGQHSHGRGRSMQGGGVQAPLFISNTNFPEKAPPPPLKNFAGPPPPPPF